MTSHTRRPLPRLRPALSRFDLLGVLTVCAAVAFLGVLAVRSRPPTAETRLEVGEEAARSGFREGEEWHGIYRGDDKIGFVRIERARLADGYQVVYHSLMLLTVLGQERRIEVDLTTTSDEAFLLRSFAGRLDTAGSQLGARATVAPVAVGRWRVDYVLETGGLEEEGELELTTPPMLQIDIRRGLLDQSPQPGQRFETSYFDPLSRADRSVVLEYVGREPVAVMGETVEAHHVRQYLGAGEPLDAWINDIGEVLVEELPLGLSGRRESRAEAMYGVLRRDEEAPAPGQHDLIEAASIPVRGDVISLASRARMRWRLAGIQPDRFSLDGGRQRAEVDERGVLLTLEREPPASATPLPAPESYPDEVRAALRSEPLIQVDAPAIVEAAESLRGPRGTATDIVEAVRAWMRDNMTQEMVVGVPSAVEVLQNRAGDCNEHATLSVALLRAAGVPARIAAGLAFLEGSFYFHAWVEYYDAGQWRTFDPTWDQHPADLGHLRLVAGGLSDQVALGEVFGSLTVEPEP
jgi:hypothetical protein